MTYYEILEVNENASEEVIKMAYKALCRKYHPDLNSGNEGFSNEKMSQVNEAYSILSDIVKRQEYDDLLRAQRNGDSSKSEKGNDDSFESETPESKPKELGFGWLKFCSIILLIYGVTDFGGVTISIFAGQIGEMAKTDIVSAIAVSILYYIIASLMIYTGYGLRKFKKSAYYTNYLLLVSNPLTIGINELGESYLAFFVGFAIVISLLNICYFKHRRFKFGLEGKSNFDMKECIVPLCIMVAVSSPVFLMQNNYVDDTSTTISSSQENGVIETSREEIEANFNELAQQYDYTDWIELVDTLNDAYDDDLSSNNPKSAYEQIATEYFGLDSYANTKSKLDPFTNEEIISFGDYQEYVLRCVKESE